MRTFSYFAFIFLTVAIFAAPAWSQKGCEANKKVEMFYPDPALYKQISTEQAARMKNYIPADQFRASIKGESSSGKTTIKSAPAPQRDKRLIRKGRK